MTAPEPSADARTTESAPGEWLDFLASATRLGHYVWLERRLFELAGGWVATTPEPFVKLAFADQSHHHAWHAQLWERLLPRTATLGPDDLIRAEPWAAAAVAELADFAEGSASGEDEPTSPTLARLVGLHRVVLPRAVSSYAAHLDATSPVRDAPVIGALRLVLQDDRDDLREGEAVLASLLATAEDHDRVEQIEERILAALPAAADAS